MDVKECRAIMAACKTRNRPDTAAFLGMSLASLHRRIRIMKAAGWDVPGGPKGYCGTRLADCPPPPVKA